MKIVIANINDAYQNLENFLATKFASHIHFIKTKEELNDFVLQKIQPHYIFFPHWSFIIPSDIYKKYNCVVFHMTDLPYGRGGSPLQNLIVRQHSSTKLSALKVAEGLDTGDIYLKKDLDLSGTAADIFERAGELMKEMIVEIVEKNIQPTPQEGEAVVFKRRKPEDGNIENLQSAQEIYDFIRMLDADHYPKAFLETKYFRFEFTKASLESTDNLSAHVRIIKK